MRFETWPDLTPYPEGIARMEAALVEVLAGGPERLIFCEHEPVFTAGSSAEASEVINPGGIPVIATGRGGKTTYHGPGQRVVYPILRLEDKDIRAYIRRLQAWLIAVLADLGVEAQTTDDVGVWVPYELGGAKIAAIGVRVRRWVAYHGIALNVNPDLTAFSRIRPCGLDKPVTSLHALGVKVSLVEVDALLQKHAARYLLVHDESPQPGR